MPTEESKRIEASFSPMSTDSLYLRVAQMPRSRDIAIFVPTTDKTDCFTPCACARGNYYVAHGKRRVKLCILGSNNISYYYKITLTRLKIFIHVLWKFLRAKTNSCEISQQN